MSVSSPSALEVNDVLSRPIDFFQRKFYSVARHQGGTKPDEWMLLPYADDGMTPGFASPHVVASLTAGNKGDADSWHAPALDLDFPVRAHIPSVGNLTIEFELHRSLTEDDVRTATEAFAKFKMAHSWRVVAQEKRRFMHIGFTDEFPAHLVKSSSKDHYHLYINKRMRWPKYELFLMYLAEARIISTPYAEFSIARRATYLRFPGITKAYLPSPPSEQPRGPHPLRSLS